MSPITRPLLDAIRRQYRLDWQGIHGLGHWQRVHTIGLKLAALSGADPRVVELFAYLHDACRHNDGYDPDHGPRAAELARSWRGKHFQLEDEPFEALCLAMEGHTQGQVHTTLEIACCWDADRLDLGRVRITPHPRFLSLEQAREREVFEWAVGLWAFEARPSRLAGGAGEHLRPGSS